MLKETVLIGGWRRSTGQGAEGLVLEGRRQGDQRASTFSRAASSLYLSRARPKDDTVFRLTIAAGADSRDFFGFAAGRGRRAVSASGFQLRQAQARR